MQALMKALRRGAVRWLACTLVTLSMQISTLAHAQPTQACRVDGIPHELQCGSVRRALDPARPNGAQIMVHFLVVPAVARNKQSDAVLMLAGGPGQSAIAVAPMVLPRLARLNNRRDLVFIDQRGTGRSAPLHCVDESRLPVAQALDPAQHMARLRQCATQLAQLPHGDMRFYTTELAMQDAEAVRQHLGVRQWNLVGASYGTRAALEYQRQFAPHVRRTVLDGVAPPDMALPTSFSTDAQAALDGVLQACEADTVAHTGCAARWPYLRRDWEHLLASLPRTVRVAHPVSGRVEQFTLTRTTVLHAARAPLYVPALASALPHAIHQAAQGDVQALVGLSSTMGSGKAQRLAMGMHFSVVCAEDLPRMATATDPPGKDFGRSDADLYAQVCAFWPRGAVNPAFYGVPPATSPVLLLSGGADPATPPRHGQRVAQALGEKARHVVVAHAGHGVLAVGCLRDVLYRFITAPTDAEALAQDAACARHLPRPLAFAPVQPDASTGATP